MTFSNEEPDINIYIENLSFSWLATKALLETVKELIQYVNSMGPRQEALEELQSCPILPVKDVHEGTALNENFFSSRVYLKG